MPPVLVIKHCLKIFSIWFQSPSNSTRLYASELLHMVACLNKLSSENFGETIALSIPQKGFMPYEQLGEYIVREINTPQSHGSQWRMSQAMRTSSWMTQKPAAWYEQPSRENPCRPIARFHDDATRMPYNNSSAFPLQLRSSQLVRPKPVWLIVLDSDTRSLWPMLLNARLQTRIDSNRLEQEIFVRRIESSRSHCSIENFESEPSKFTCSIDAQLEMFEMLEEKSYT